MITRVEPLVSIVTPVYNGDPYLIECIESILAQTYRNWDYTIVNNCSTDATLDIAESYAAKDPRIRIHNNKKFAPIIENHNIAFHAISPSSRYCKMVYADDWMFPECLTCMVQLAEAHPSIGLVCAYALRQTEVVWDGLPYPSSLISGREMCRWALLGDPYVFGTPTSMMIRSDLIRKRRHFCNIDNIHADTEICYTILEESDFGFVHQVLAFMRTENEGQSSFAKRINTYIAGILSDVLKYGPKFLTEEEYESRRRAVIDSYYDFLAYHVFKRREREFWQYHTSELTKLGLPLNRSRLLLKVAAMLVDALLNPKRTIENRFKRLFKKSGEKG